MRQAVAFVVLTFVLSWSAWGAAATIGDETGILRIAGNFGPALAAIILAVLAGRGELGRLLSGFARWRAPVWVWAFALGSTAAVGLAALVIDASVGGAVAWPGWRHLTLIPVIFVWVLVFSVAGEETGWRGWLLPRLLARTGPVRASLMIGLVWALWHLPLWIMPGDFHGAIPMTLFAVQILGFSVLYTWLWLRSGGSLMIAHVFHAASNTTLGVLPLLAGEGAEDLRPLWIAVGLLCLISVVVAVQLAKRAYSSPGARGRGQRL